MPIVTLCSTAALLFLAYSAFGHSQKPVAQQKTKGANILNKKAASLSSFSQESTGGLPARLKIPKIKVDTKVAYMGLTKTGDMAVPSNVKDAGWYKYGAHPGNNGSAVIAGHLDGLKGEAGVFVDLNKLRKGDSLMVVDNKGQATFFTVKETRIYGQTEQPGEVFNRRDGTHLNLITCTGAWNKTQHRFAKRLVVFTDKSN